MGNDFLLFDQLSEASDLSAGLVARLCDRHFGIGADGLLLLRPGKRAPYRMLLYNLDGTPAEMSGNGIRCLARYLWDQGLVQGEEVAVETGAGMRSIRYVSRNGGLEGMRVDMGEPGFEREKIPMLGSPGEVGETPIRAAGQDIRIFPLSMGNPHCVIFVDDLSAIDMGALGPAIERSDLFPERTNVEFVRIESPEAISMRIWERGVGETLACGTGASAAVAAGARLDRLSRRVEVGLPGGKAEVIWAQDNHLYLTGPAQTVFSGEIDLKQMGSGL